MQREREPDELIFTAERGGRIDTSNLMARVLKPAAVRAGLGEWVKAKRVLRTETWVGFHSFRHTCGTMLFRDGWNAKQVCMFLGHTDPGFTLRTYVHQLDDDLPEPQVLATVEGNKGQQEPPKQTETPLVPFHSRAGKVGRAETYRNGCDALVMKGSPVRVRASALPACNERGRPSRAALASTSRLGCASVGRAVGTPPRRS